MKLNLSLLFLGCLAVSGLLLSGCGGKTKMDTASYEAAKALKAGKYLDGATALANLAKSAEKMTDEQKQSMTELGITLQVIMSEDGDKMDLKLWQAVEDMLAALEGRESAQVGTDPDRVRPPVVEPE
jgi:hypothetical protein